MPAFALDLNHDGIRLLRNAYGEWSVMGEVALDDPDLPRRLHAMRAAAERASVGPLETELIIPPSQILYATVPLPEDAAPVDRAHVAQALEGLTPCPIEETVFDWQRDGDVLKVAALDANTLDEAETFAATYGFNPVRFTARPAGGEFPTSPDFGPTQIATFAEPQISEPEPEPAGPESAEPETVDTENPEPEASEAQDQSDVPPPTLSSDVEDTGPALAEASAENEDADVPDPVIDPGDDDPAEVELADEGAEPEPQEAGETATPSDSEEPAPVFVHDDGSGNLDDIKALTALDLALDAEEASEPEATSDATMAKEAAVDAEPPTEVEADDAAPLTDALKEAADEADPALEAASEPVDPPVDDANLSEEDPGEASNDAEDEAAVAALAEVENQPNEDPLEASGKYATPADPSEPDAEHDQDDGDGLDGDAEPDTTPEGDTEPEEAEPAVPIFAAPIGSPEHTPVDAIAVRLPPNATARAAASPIAAERASLASILGPATAALLLCGVLVWTALYLVSPKVETSLPEVAETPQPIENSEPDTPRPVPSRIPPMLTALAPVPPLPDDAQSPDLSAAIGERQAIELVAVRAPDPTTEVGVLKSADTWQTLAGALIEPTESTNGEVYIAAIDQVVLVDDALALLAPNLGNAPLQVQPVPPQPNEEFDFDDRGLVRATPDGALTPEGVLVTLGRPPLEPPKRPDAAIEANNAAQALTLEGKEPQTRPEDLVERAERASLGGRTREELSGFRPKPRPVSAQREALSAQEDQSPSPLAVAVSRAPSRRPADFATVVALAQQTTRTAPQTQPQATVQPAAAATVAPAQPRIPTSASVARQATIENAINLRQLNLIGVYGTDTNRRALIRLPSGRFVKVKVGDRIGGGQVAAIGDGTIRLIKGGRAETLTVPAG